MRSPMQEIRDAFLDSILARFPQLDADEIYEILRQFKKPFISLIANGDTDGQNENSVQEPWDFSYLAINNDQIRSPNEVSMADDQNMMRRSDALVNGIEIGQVEQDMRRLSLEKQQK